MRVPLLIVAALLLAGCTAPAPRVAPTSENTIPDNVQPASADKPAASEPAPPPPEPPTPAPSASSASNGTAPAPEEPKNVSAPAPKPYEVKANGALGYAVGLPGPAPVQPGAMPDKCPDATSSIPAGAARFVVKLSGSPAGQDGVGNFDLTILKPDGKSETLSSDPTTISPDAPVVLNKTYDAPPGGAWKFHVSASPASAGAQWTLELTLAGEGATPTLSVKGTC